MKKDSKGKTSPKKKLTLKQERFCQLYTSPGKDLGNGTQAYIEAFSIDIKKKGQYGVARQQAYTLLTNAHILSRVRELLDLGPLSNESLDRELAFVITQNADLSAKIAGIREANKVKGRIIEKIDHTTKGKSLPAPILNAATKDDK